MKTLLDIHFVVSEKNIARPNTLPEFNLCEEVNNQFLIVSDVDITDAEIELLKPPVFHRGHTRFRLESGLRDQYVVKMAFLHLDRKKATARQGHLSYAFSGEMGFIQRQPNGKYTISVKDVSDFSREPIARPKWSENVGVHRATCMGYRERPASLSLHRLWQAAQADGKVWQCRHDRNILAAAAFYQFYREAQDWMMQTGINAIHTHDRGFVVRHVDDLVGEYPGMGMSSQFKIQGNAGSTGYRSNKHDNRQYAWVGSHVGFPSMLNLPTVTKSRTTRDGIQTGSYVETVVVDICRPCPIARHPDHGRHYRSNASYLLDNLHRYPDLIRLINSFQVAVSTDLDALYSFSQDNGYNVVSAEWGIPGDNKEFLNLNLSTGSKNIQDMHKLFVYIPGLSSANSLLGDSISTQVVVKGTDPKVVSALSEHMASTNTSAVYSACNHELNKLLMMLEMS